MNKIFLTLIAILLISTIAKSQFFTQLDFGYNFPVYKKTNEFVDITKYNNDYERVQTNTTKRVNISLTQGFNAGLSGGYVYKNKYQFEIGINYFNNNEINQKNNSFISDSIYIDGSHSAPYYSCAQQTKTNTYSSNIITITPGFMYLKQYGNFILGIKIGLSAQYVTIYEQYDNYYTSFDSIPQTDTYSSYKIDSLFKYEYPSRFYFNLYTGMNIMYNITKNISVLFSVNLPLTNYAYTTSSNKKTQYYSRFTSDIYDENNIAYNEKEHRSTIIENKEKYEVENTNNYKFYSTAVNLSFGVRYTFGK